MAKDSNGWIKLHRKIQDSDGYFNEPFCRNMAWVDMLMLANHEDNYFRVRGIRVYIKRGQIGFTSEKLASRWKWSRGKVLRFLMELQIDNQIVQQKNNITTLISILNYELYQGDGTADSTANRTTNSTTDGQQTVQQTDINKNDNNYKNDNNINKINAGGEISPPRTPEMQHGFNYLPDGRSYIEPTFFFKASDFNGLPDENLQSIITFFDATKKIQVEPDRVTSMWSVFKTQELTEQKPYRNKEDVYRHFLNWCKKQSFTKERKPAVKNYQKEKPLSKVTGVEFINNFSQCLMSDNSIQDLDVNQKDLAKYNHINPSSISKK